MLDGYKTYIVAVLLGLTAAGEFLGYVDAETQAKLRRCCLAGA